MTPNSDEDEGGNATDCLSPVALHAAFAFNHPEQSGVCLSLAQPSRAEPTTGAGQSGSQLFATTSELANWLHVVLIVLRLLNKTTQLAGPGGVQLVRPTRAPKRSDSTGSVAFLVFANTIRISGRRQSDGDVAVSSQSPVVVVVWTTTMLTISCFLLLLLLSSASHRLERTCSGLLVAVSVVGSPRRPEAYFIILRPGGR